VLSSGLLLLGIQREAGGHYILDSTELVPVKAIDFDDLFLGKDREIVHIEKSYSKYECQGYVYWYEEDSLFRCGICGAVLDKSDVRAYEQSGILGKMFMVRVEQPTYKLLEHPDGYYYLGIVEL
jgi:hypothetical protein